MVFLFSSVICQVLYDLMSVIRSKRRSDSHSQWSTTVGTCVKYGVKSVLLWHMKTIICSPSENPSYLSLDIYQNAIDSNFHGDKEQGAFSSLESDDVEMHWLSRTACSID
jgi:hypothetical protein